MSLHQKLEQLIASWPDDRGDPPDTDYQRGYMAAAAEHARELADALRTPAAAVGDDAVERVAEAEQPPNDGSVHRDDPMEDLRQAARMIRTWIPDVYPTNEAGQVPFARALMESVADAIESALAAMPGSGMADAALRAVMGLNSVQTLFEAAEEYPHGEEDVAAELAALKLARAAMARGTGNG